MNLRSKRSYFPKPAIVLSWAKNWLRGNIKGYFLPCYQSPCKGLPSKDLADVMSKKPETDSKMNAQFIKVNILYTL